MTELAYLQNLSAFEAEAVIIAKGTDEKGMYLILDKTLFYPQGGGQPADKGVICIEDSFCLVEDVKSVDGSIRHYIQEFPPISFEGMRCKLQVDALKRRLHSAYHTAGHLLSAVVETFDPGLKAVKGHQFPGEAYIEFQGFLRETSNFINAVEKEINKNIWENFPVETKDLELEAIRAFQLKLPYELPKDKKIRICKIGPYEAIPCGGTHVSHLKDIGQIVLTGIKSKKGKTKISYEVKSEIPTAV